MMTQSTLKLVIKKKLINCFLLHEQYGLLIPTRIREI
jgi:hypothetical protein